jgi:putative lipoic acid-binding regulatory protein
MSHSTSSTPSASLIEFPCSFPIKVMGLATEDLTDQIIALTHTFQPYFDPSTIEKRPSQTGKYLGLTITVYVHSQSELDAIYRAFTSHPLVKVVL